MSVQIRHGNESHASLREGRDVWRSMLNGWLGRCPHCGEGKLFGAFLKPVHACQACGEEMHHQRADDLPPYLVIFITGHIVLGAYLIFEELVVLNTWQHLAIWAPLTIIMAFVLMQPVKGAVIGLQWANFMHGFGGEKDEIADIDHYQ